MDRRTFAGALGAWAFAGRGRPVGRAGAPPPGIQLYTVRGLAARDLDGTLAALGAMGYQEVEFAGYHGHAPAEVRKMLDRAGLRAPSAHKDLAELQGDALARTLEEAHVAGHRYVVLAWVPVARYPTAASWRALGEILDQAGEEARKAGVTVGYHNHDFEFSPVAEGRPLDLLLESTNPGTVAFELDIYWASKAGQDARALLARHRGRFRMAHVKDMAAGAERRMADPGEGVLDFDAILPAAAAAGVEHYFIEHDYPPDAMATARKGLALLQRTAR